MPMNCMVFKAAAEGKLDILRRTEHLEDQLTPNKNTVLQIHITGGMAGTQSMLRICPSLLRQKNSKGQTPRPSLLRQKNSKGETPLHMAAKEGLTRIMKVLVDQVKALNAYDATYQVSGMRLAVKEMVGMRNEEGDTALHEAVRYRRPDVVKLLIGEDPEFEYGGNNAGETPLYMAVKRGFDELVDEILTAALLD